MKNKTACFTGHRDIPPLKRPGIKHHLEREIEKSIQAGYVYFGAGGALGFDTLAAQTVLKLKERHPDIKLILVLPCKTQTSGWKQTDIDEYERIKAAADKVVYTSEVYYRGCMYKSMRPGKGRCAVVMPQGVLFHGGREGEIRKKMIETDCVECVVTLVGNLFYGAGVEAYLNLSHFNTIWRRTSVVLQ